MQRMLVTAKRENLEISYESDPDSKRVVDVAKGLEGLKRQWGVHAAGVILLARTAARCYSHSSP
jgi:DNA polymerase III alpha subunit